MDGTVGRPRFQRVCSFNFEGAGVGYMNAPCPLQPTECGMCACSGPCVHELNPVCERHAGFIEGWIEAQPRTEEDSEGLDAVAEAAARFITITNKER